MIDISTFEDRRRDRYYTIDTNSSQSQDHRNDFRRDRDRILYCSAFRRLSGITQVISPSGSHPTHNRLTHSLEVAQIGRSIAERLTSRHTFDVFEPVGGLDPEVVEAAALAHDLGHPPFGHIAESVLCDLLDEEPNFRQGFEGNAQSFRILTRLATRYDGVPGLNLTRATLSGVTKYPWRRGDDGKREEKWGAYASDGRQFDWSRTHLPETLRESKTLEAEIMDYSDDVAYAIHDLEDFFRADVVPLDRLANDMVERRAFLESFQVRNEIPDANLAQFEQVFSDLVVLFPDRPYNGSRISKSTLRSFTSGFVSRYVTGFTFEETSGAHFISPRVEAEIRLLKSLTSHYVIESRALLTTRVGHANVIASLFRMLMTAATETDRNGKRYHDAIFPEQLREQMAEGNYREDVLKRTVADTIASLTESQAVNLHQRLTGNSLGPALDPIL